jgi:hypothetical protein
MVRPVRPVLGLVLRRGVRPVLQLDVRPPVGEAVYAALRAVGGKLMISWCSDGPPVFPEFEAVCNIIVVKGPRETTT